MILTDADLATAWVAIVAGAASGASFLIGFKLGNRAGQDKGYSEGHRAGYGDGRTYQARMGKGPVVFGENLMRDPPAHGENVDRPRFTKDAGDKHIVIEPKRSVGKSTPYVPWRNR